MGPDRVQPQLHYVSYSPRGARRTTNCEIRGEQVGNSRYGAHYRCVRCRRRVLTLVLTNSQLLQEAAANWQGARPPTWSYTHPTAGV